VDYFSRGLHAEYKSKGIIVQVSSFSCKCGYHSNIGVLVTKGNQHILLFMNMTQIRDEDFL